MRLTVLLLLVSATFTVLPAQESHELALQVGIGIDIVPSSMMFRNDHSRSATISYNIADDWGITFYLSQQDYSLDRLNSDHVSFVGGSKPDVGMTVTSFLVGPRWYIPSRWKAMHPYVSVLAGYAKSAPSAQEYYLVTSMNNDTSYQHISTGDFFLGLLSGGIEIRPLSFVNMFAELQVVIPSSIDLSPGFVGGRIGLGLAF